MESLAFLGDGGTPLLVVAVVGLIAAAVDVRVFKVHNVLTVPLLVSGMLFHGFNNGIAGLGFSLLGVVVGFATLILFYAMGGIGAGDVKLMAGVGAWLGAWLTLQVFVIAGLAAGAYSLFLMLTYGGAHHVYTNFSILVYRVRALALHFGQEERVESVIEESSNRRRRLIPFAAMVVVGVAGIILRHQLKS